MMRTPWRAIRHYLFVGLAGLSLLLAVVLTLLWAYLRNSFVVYRPLSIGPTIPSGYPAQRLFVALDQDGLWLQHRGADKPPVQVQWMVGPWIAAPNQLQPSMWRIRSGDFPDIGTDRAGIEWNFGNVSFVVIPLPLIVLMLLVSPVCAGSRVLWRHLRSKGPGYCAQCGYDLRASKDRCPECGKAIPESAAQAVPSGNISNPNE